MRLLHTADLHLGKVLHEQSLLEDQGQVLDQLARELETGNYHLFVVAGDVFDRSVPPPEAVTLWDDFLHRIAACPGLQSVVIPGNHDGAARLAFASRFLAGSGIHVRTQIDFEPLNLILDGTEWQVFTVPFLPAGTLETLTPEGPAVLRSQRDLWAEARARLEAARRPGLPSLLVAHLFTQGGAESDSERVFVGEAEQVPASWLSGWDYVALGHLHRPQEPAPGVRYSGSPLAYSFSEAGQEKVALAWDQGVVTPIPLKPSRPLTRLRGGFDDFVRGNLGEDSGDHWVEITLTDPALVPNAMERLRPRFPGLLSLVQAPTPVEPLATPSSRTGDLASDTLRFLAEVGLPTPGLEALVTRAAREVVDAAP